MEKYIITTGKNIDLAISAALAELNMDRDSVSVEVLENARSGFLGIGACPAKVKVSYEVPDPKPAEPAPALSSASRKPKKQAPKLDKPLEMPKLPELKPEPKAEPKPEAPKPVQTEAPRKQAPRREAPRKEAPKAAPKPDAPKAAPKGETSKAAPKAEAPRMERPAKVYAAVEPGSPEEKVEKFLKGLLERMDSDAVPHAVRKDEETISVELAGENLGKLIGRRGETLDAIQHLANYALNHDSSKRIRVNVDAENYRGKREESLQHLARKMAAKVVKYRKNMTLEPMNAYERHVIHATLQDVPHVTTYSTGTEPNRRVIVAYEK